MICSSQWSVSGVVLNNHLPRVQRSASICDELLMKRKLWPLVFHKIAAEGEQARSVRKMIVCRISTAAAESGQDLMRNALMPAEAAGESPRCQERYGRWLCGEMEAFLVRVLPVHPFRADCDQSRSPMDGERMRYICDYRGREVSYSIVLRNALCGLWRQESERGSRAVWGGDFAVRWRRNRHLCCRFIYCNHSDGIQTQAFYERVAYATNLGEIYQTANGIKLCGDRRKRVAMS